MNNNGIGVCGIAGGSGNDDEVKIMCVRTDYRRRPDAIRRRSAGGSAEAIYYAADNNMGASFLQCSWGLYASTQRRDQEYLDEQRIGDERSIQ